MATSNKLRSRGVSLVEAMVALAVMAFGMLAVVGVQSTLRLNADIARQRSEAIRIAEREMERQRAFILVNTPPPGGPYAYADIVVRGPDVVTWWETAAKNTEFTVRRDVKTTADPPSKVLRMTVQWTDRAGVPQQVVLSSVISSAVPALSGTLAIRPGTAPVGAVRRPFRRHPSIPTVARDFGTSSAFVPPFRPWMAIVFNNITGVVTGVCNFNFDTSNDAITPQDIASCSNNTVGQLLSGFVRFNRSTSGGPLTAADVEDPQGPALNMRMQLTLTSTGHPSGSFCIDDANSFSVGGGALPFATYYCVILSNSSALWSGTTMVEARSTFGSDSWQISDTPLAPSPGNAGDFRVCRYTSASSDSQTVSNQEHPRNYSNVAGNLTNQNFVVISSSKTCPTDVPANPSAGDFVNSNTLQHQPAPST